MTASFDNFSSPAGLRSKSYINNIPRSSDRHRKDTRKTDVKDSLIKFLDDCGDEDLLMSAAYSPPKKSNLSLSRSEHGPSPGGPVGSSMDSATPKRRGTKNNRPFASPMKEGPQRRRSSTSIGYSEHGTPSTEKKALSAMCLDVQGHYLDDDEISISSEGSFAEDGNASSRDSPKRRGSARSTSNRQRSKSGDKSRSRSKSKDSSRTSSSSRKPSSHKSVKRSTSERGGRSPGSNSKRSSSRSVRRTKSDSTNRSLGSQLAGLDRQSSTRRRRSSSSFGGIDDDNRSVCTSRSSFSTVSAAGRRSSLGVDAGPLNAFLNTGERRGSIHGSSGASIGPGVQPEHLDEKAEAFLNQRRERQKAILDEAQKDRWGSKKTAIADSRSDIHEKNVHDIQDLDDDDQPMVQGPKKSALSRLKKGISKTGSVMRDPRRAARKVSGFAKGVGKETGKMLLDPKLAAKTAVSLGKDVTKGTLNVTRGVGMNVAMGGIGITKTVARTGLDATTMVVGGAGKVVTGATGLIFKHQVQAEDDCVEYNAAELEHRRRRHISLLDRVAGSEAATDKEDKNPRNTRLKGHIPSLDVCNGNKGGWEF